MAALVNWWQRLSARERGLIGIMLALALMVLLSLAVVRPLAAYVASAQPRLEAAERLRSFALSARTPVGGAAQSAQSALPLEERIRSTAAEAGFDSVTLSPSNGGFAIVLPAARAPALYAWLKALEGRGVVVRSARIDTRSDATLAVALDLEAGR